MNLNRLVQISILAVFTSSTLFCKEAKSQTNLLASLTPAQIKILNKACANGTQVAPEDQALLQKYCDTQQIEPAQPSSLPYYPSTSSTTQPPNSPSYEESVNVDRTAATNPGQTIKFGSLSRSETTGRYGWAAGYDDQETAKNAAIQGCGSADCQGIIWFGNAIGVLAQANDKSWSSSWGSTQEQAVQEALKACQGYSSLPDTCKVVIVVDSEEGVIFEQ